MKKVFCIAMSLLMICSLIPTSLAVDTYAGNTIDDSELFISSEMAEEIAELFVLDMTETGTVLWDESTEVNCTVPMLDEDSENVTAYSVELDSGYVVVSAYIDVPNIILEWSDTAAPLYDSLELNSDDTIVYCGALCYYRDNGGQMLEGLDGSYFNRSEVNNTLAEIRDITNVPATLMALHAGGGQQYELTSTVPGSDDEILNPITHANTWYNGPYTNNDYQNHWETASAPSIECYSTTEFEDLDDRYFNHCGPTAITNAIIMYGNRFSVSSITNTSHLDIFRTVATVGTTNYYYVNGSVLGGTAEATMSGFIRDSFTEYGVTVQASECFDVTYTNVKTSLAADRLLMVSLRGHQRYNNHFVVCYAYTRLVSSADGSYATYLKVADGWRDSPRYIDLASIGSSSSYLAINFSS